VVDYDVVVVGGGHNGLVAAAVLAGHGARVLVCEKNPWPGGLAGGVAWGLPDSLFAYAVGLVPGRLRMALGLELPLHRPDPSWVVLGEDGVWFRWWRGRERLRVEAREAGVDGLVDLLDVLGRFVECLEERGLLYTARAPSREEVATVADECGVGGVADRSTEALLAEFLPREWWDTLIYPSMLSANAFSLAWYYLSGGVWDQPIGGMGAVAGAFLGLARERGARVELGCRARLLVEGGRVSGVVVGGSRVRARAVLWTPPAYALLSTEAAPLFSEEEWRWLSAASRARSMVVRVDFLVSGRPSPPREEGWRGHPIIVYWHSRGGGEYTYPTLVEGRGPPHLVRFSGAARDPMDVVPPGVEPGDVAAYWARGRRDQELCCGNATGHPDHVPMVDPYLYDRRPVPGWGSYRTSVPGLYHGSASSYPEVSGVPGVNAAARILVDLGVRPRLPLPLGGVEEGA